MKLDRTPPYDVILRNGGRETIVRIDEDGDLMNAFGDFWNAENGETRGFRPTCNIVAYADEAEDQWEYAAAGFTTTDKALKMGWEINPNWAGHGTYWRRAKVAVETKEPVHLESNGLPSYAFWKGLNHHLENGWEIDTDLEPMGLLFPIRPKVAAPEAEEQSAGLVGYVSFKYGKPYSIYDTLEAALGEQEDGETFYDLSQLPASAIVRPEPEKVTRKESAIDEIRRRKPTADALHKDKDDERFCLMADAILELADKIGSTA